MKHSAMVQLGAPIGAIGGSMVHLVSPFDTSPIMRVV